MTGNRELQDLAHHLRRDSIRMTTEAGSGHPTSCMSCAELVSVLFFDEMSFDSGDAYNPDNDEFVLSKGHAAPIYYAALEHAGCIEAPLESLRDLDSQLQGHPMPASIDWVKVATGSLGQGLSIGAGMALAARKQGRNYNTYVLLGDSETAEGQVYEALQLSSYYDLDNLVAIVDVNRLGQRGETMLGHRLDWYRDRFSSFGWNVETIDGHEIGEIRAAFDSARQSDRPTVIAAHTVKGKGFSEIEGENGWHGKPLSEEQKQRAFEEIPDPEVPDVSIEEPEPSDVEEAEPDPLEPVEYEKGEELATRDAYGKALKKLVAADPEVLAVDAEVSNSTRSEFIKQVNEEQFVEAFIAEQNMAGMAQGLSVKGFEVFASTFSAFLSRAHDQIRMAALSDADFNFVGSHAGVSIGEDGASQMGLSDIALFRALRNSHVYYPADAVATERLAREMYGDDNLCYLRTTRPETPVIYDSSESFPVGDFKEVKDPGDADAVIAGAGITLHEALEAAGKLEDQGVRTAVADIYCVKPFEEKPFIDFVKDNGNRLVVTEDHYPEGGIGEMLGKKLEESGIEMRTLAVEKIPHSGEKQELLHATDIGRHGIIDAVEELV